MKTVKVTATGNPQFLIFENSESQKVDIGNQVQANLFFLFNKSRDIEIEVNINGSNSLVRILGLVYIRDKETINLKTLQKHNAPNSKSELFVKSVLSDQAKFTYRGNIYVAKIAQKTDAYQRNENLLTNLGTQVESNPELEIMANDVRCTHGVTISYPSVDQIYYLQTRGIRSDQAISLITSSFLTSELSKIESGQVCQKVENLIKKWFN